MSYDITVQSFITALKTADPEIQEIVAEVATDIQGFRFHLIPSGLVISLLREHLVDVVDEHLLAKTLIEEAKKTNA